MTGWPGPVQRWFWRAGVLKRQSRGRWQVHGSLKVTSRGQMKVVSADASAACLRINTVACRRRYAQDACAFIIKRDGGLLRDALTQGDAGPACVCAPSSSLSRSQLFSRGCGPRCGTCREDKERIKRPKFPQKQRPRCQKSHLIDKRDISAD